MNRNILRQISDIQAQAERITLTKIELTQIEDFSKYNEEIKRFLLENVKDEFILNYIREIPSLNFESLETKDNLLTIIIGFFGGGLLSYYRQNQKNEEALNKVREIRGKYASAEFMLKNYFAD